MAISITTSLWAAGWMRRTGAELPQAAGPFRRCGEVFAGQPSLRAYVIDEKGYAEVTSRSHYSGSLRVVVVAADRG